MQREYTLAAVMMLALCALAAIALVVRDRRRAPSWSVWVLYVIERLYMGIAYRWRSNRPCPFPAKSGALIIANHRSPVDPLILWMNHEQSDPRRKIRVIEFLTAREYCETGIIGWICRAVHVIPVERKGKDMGPTRTALRRLEQGAWVGIFPEGGINEAGDPLLPGDPGMAWLALRSQVPVYPVYIRNAPLGKTMVEPFLRFQRVGVVYGDPIDLSEYYERRKSPQVLEEVTDLLMSRIAALGGIGYRSCREASAASNAG